MRSYDYCNEYDFDETFDNPNVFYRLSTGDKKLIRYFHLKRGDVFIKSGTTYLVRYVDENVINYGNFSVFTRQTGGGAIHCNLAGSNSQCIVEYVGIYKYKQRSNKAFGGVPDRYNPKTTKAA